LPGNKRHRAAHWAHRKPPACATTLE
jgi:hypothetical protein